MKRKGWLHTNPDFSGGDDQEKAALEEEERRRKKAPRLQIPTFDDNQHQIGQHCEQVDKKKATPTSKIGDSDDNESGKAEDAPSNNKEVSRPVATLLLPHVPLRWFSPSHTGCLFSLGLPLKYQSTEKLILARLGVSRTIYVNVDSPNLGFSYSNFSGKAQCKKTPCTLSN